MSVNLLVNRSAIITLQALKNASKCYYATKVKGIVADLNVEETPDYEIEVKFDEEEISQMRNKSRLWTQHRRILHGQKPYDESKEYYHDTVWYKKKLLGKYGIDAVDAPVAVCWPTKEEIEDKKEYEALAYISDLKKEWEEIEIRKKEAAEKIRTREEEIDKVVANFDKWKAALKAKVEKKEAELRAAKEKKEQMMKELKEQFGYNIDPRDERFQEMLAKKEKEDKKRTREEKKKKKTEKMMAHLKKQAEESEQKIEQSKANPQPDTSKTDPAATKDKIEQNNENAK